MPMVVRFETRREDFPPNFDELRIQQVVLAFSRADEAPFEVPVAHPHFNERGATSPVGGGATTNGASSAPVEAMRQAGRR
jgi:hypothetical protein